MLGQPPGQALTGERGEQLKSVMGLDVVLMRSRVELRPGDYVTISASRYPFANVMTRGRRSEDWISSITRTLQWNSRQRQKSFKEWSRDS